MGHNHHSTSDGVSQRVNSPRFSGPMTRRAHSFKRNNNGNSHSTTNNTSGNTTLSPHNQIELQINSPRSEIGSNLLSAEGLELVLERKHTHHVIQRTRAGVVKGLLKKPIESIVVEFGLKERKKLGHWMFLVFCGVCYLFLGVLKICVTGWFGSAIEQANSNQVNYSDKHLAAYVSSYIYMSVFMLACSTVMIKCPANSQPE